jgi:hypothetical protein
VFKTRNYQNSGALHNVGCGLPCATSPINSKYWVLNTSLDVTFWAVPSKIHIFPRSHGSIYITEFSQTTFFLILATSQNKNKKSI